MNRQERTLIVSMAANLLLIGMQYGLAMRIDSLVWRGHAGRFLVDMMLALGVYGGLVFSRMHPRHRRLHLVDNGITWLVASFIFYAAYGVFRGAMTSAPPPEPRHLWLVTIAALLTITLTYIAARYREYVGQTSHALSLMASGRHMRALAYVSVLIAFNQVSAAIGMEALEPLVVTLAGVAVLLTGWQAIRPALQEWQPHTVHPAVHAAVSRLRRFTPLWIGLAIGIAAVVMGFAGSYTLQPGERGVVRRFGRVIANVGPGLHYRIPWVDQLDRVALDQVRQTQTEKPLLVLTGDTNLIELNLRIHYRVTDAAAFLFNVSQPRQFVAWTAEAIIRQVLAEQGVDGLLTTGRIAIEAQTRTQSQTLLDQHHSGLQITSIQLVWVKPPAAVAKDFRDVASAREDTNTAINEAQGYHNEIIPEARGTAAQIIRTAEAEKQRKIDQAAGEADRFLQQLQAYHLSPHITRIRLYLEALERVLPAAHKFILDPSIRTETTDLWFTNGNPPDKPLDAPVESGQ